MKTANRAAAYAANVRHRTHLAAAAKNGTHRNVNVSMPVVRADIAHRISRNLIVRRAIHSVKTVNRAAKYAVNVRHRTHLAAAAKNGVRRNVSALIQAVRTDIAHRINRNPIVRTVTIHIVRADIPAVQNAESVLAGYHRVLAETEHHTIPQVAHVMIARHTAIPEACRAGAIRQHHLVIKHIISR